MKSATRLTRQGRILEATGLLQGTLRRALAGVAGLERAAPIVPHAAEPVSRPVARTARPLHQAEPETARDPATGPRRSAPFTTGTHTFDGMTRTFRLFVPSTVAAAPALVVMLHGCTQDPDDFATGTRMNEAAERDGFVVLYPRQSRDANPSVCWNWFGTREQSGGGEAAFVADLTRRIVSEFGVDPGRVYIAGLSAGGAMAATVASANPTLFAAAAVHSGLPPGAAGNLPDALSAMRSGARRHGGSSVPTIVFHGDADRTVHPANGDALIASVVGDARRPRQDRSDAQVTRTAWLDADGATRAEHWLLHGAGHAWAGGDARGTYTDPKGIDATAEVVRFFDAHRGSSTRSGPSR